MTKSINEQFLQASIEGNLEEVKRLLKMGADINFQNIDGYPSLHLATLKGHCAVVKSLSRLGADINLQDVDGDTALMIANYKGDFQILYLLLCFGADINLQNKEGNTVLHSAALKGDLTVVKSLLRLGADINLQNEKGETALMLAAENGHLTVVENLEENSSLSEKVAGLFSLNKLFEWVNQIYSKLFSEKDGKSAEDLSFDEVITNIKEIRDAKDNYDTAESKFCDKLPELECSGEVKVSETCEFYQA